MSQFKVIAITKDGQFYRIGPSFSLSAWYDAKNVSNVPVKKDDVVKIEFQKNTTSGGNDLLTKIEVVGAGAEKSIVNNVPATSKPIQTETSNIPSVGGMSFISDNYKEESNRTIEVSKIVASIINALISKDKLAYENISQTTKELYEVFNNLGIKK